MLKPRSANKKIPRTILLGLLVILSLIAIIVGGYSFWTYHRPLPPNATEPLFSGVTYIRETRSQPRPLVIHIIKIDLANSNIRFLVTPGETLPKDEVRARLTSQFLQENHLQLAINGSFFTPWWSNSIFDYYPHVGDPANISGFAASQGAVYSPVETGLSTFYISFDNHVTFDQPASTLYNAISGNVLLLKQGEIPAEALIGNYLTDIHPRTAVALSQDGRTMLWVVVDGRQPNYSEGVNMEELAHIILEYGGDTALNLDGGGSSTLVMADQSGQPLILNSPIDSRIPGRERPVANHLGIFAAPLQP